MSWLGDGVSEDQWRAEAIRRYRELAPIAQDGGIILAHENCTGWGGLGAQQMRDLIESVDSPALRVLLDIGNIVGYGFGRMDMYETIKELICYIHIKDNRYATAEGDGIHGFPVQFLIQVYT